MSPSYLNTYVLDAKVGNVFGDNKIRSVQLVGTKENKEDLYSEQIWLLISNDVYNSPIKIPLQNAGGYDGELFLGSFVSKKRVDILVKIDTGGSGGYILSYLYTFKNYEPVLIFSSEWFNTASAYNVNFKDNFTAQVVNTIGTKEYLLNLSTRKNVYVDSGIYSKNGKLLNNTEGGVLGLGALFPYIKDYNGVFELHAYQRIIGINNADTLGSVNSYLKWYTGKIVFDRADVSIVTS